MTPTSLEALEHGLSTWAGSVSRREVLIEGEGGPPPASAYLAISLRSCSPMQRADVHIDPHTETVNALHRLTWRFSLHGGPAMADATRLLASLWSAQRWRDLWRIAGLGEVGRLHNLAGLDIGRWRARVEFQLTLHAVLHLQSTAEFFVRQPIDLHETDLGLIAPIAPD